MTPPPAPSFSTFSRTSEPQPRPASALCVCVCVCVRMAQAIAEGLKYNTTLLKLDLSSNTIDEKGTGGAGAWACVGGRCAREKKSGWALGGTSGGDAQEGAGGPWEVRGGAMRKRERAGLYYRVRAREGTREGAHRSTQGRARPRARVPCLQSVVAPAKGCRLPPSQERQVVPQAHIDDVPAV